MSESREPYVRPNALWVCGGTGSDCESCSGPVLGRCSARPRCQPIKMGDKWVSTLDPKLGTCLIGPMATGQCCQGPGVCSPRVSMRGYRRAFVWGCVALTLAFLFCGFSPPWRGKLLAPGPLTSHHAQVLSGQGMDRCAACHQAAQDSFSQWLASTVSPARHRSTSQPQLCLKCHGEQIEREWALSPHNLDPADLAQLTATISGRPIAQTVSADHMLACSTCHREHQGSEHDLRQLTDQQCQTCHATTVHRFEIDHLEFAPTFPARRRSRIAFDHVSHKSQHFASKDRAFDCRACHVGDALQNVQMLASFESTCRECHEGQIVENEGLAFLAVPLLDLGALRQHGLEIADWPLAATGQFDGRIPPLMRVLLSADAEVGAALNQLGSQFQFSDIDADNAEQVRLAVVVANEIVELIDELAVDAQATLRTRMARSLGVKTDAPALDAWMARLPIEQLRSLKDTWFERSTISGKDGSSFWIPSDDDVLARRNTTLQPQDAATAVDDQQLAPNPLKDKMRPMTRGPAIKPEPQTNSPPPSPVEARRKTDAESSAPISDDELLAVNPLRGGNLPPLPHPALAAPYAGGNKTSAETTTTRPTDPALSAGESTNHSSRDAMRSTNQSLDSHWRSDERTFTVTYHPTEHVDASLKSLFDLVAGSENKSSNRSVQLLFQQLTSEVGAGTCGKCHTVDREQDAHVVNWKAVYRTTSTRGFTAFSHYPHLLDSSGGSCVSCHRLDESERKSVTFHGDDPHKFASNFTPIRKADCAACHQQGMAKNTCTECHNYHVGSPVSLKDN